MANTKEIIARMVQITEGTKKESEKQLMAFLQVLEECVENKEDVKVSSHFGMKIVERAGRTGRNPQSGEVIQIAAKNAIKTTIYKSLKDKIVQ